MNRLEKHQEMFFAASVISFDCMVFRQGGEDDHRLGAAAVFDELGYAYFHDVDEIIGGKATVEWMVESLREGWATSVVGVLRNAAGDLHHILEDVDARPTWA